MGITSAVTGLATAGIGLGEQASGGSSGPAVASSGGVPSIYMPQNPGWADSGFQSLTNSFLPGVQGYFGQQQPQIRQQVSNSINNPYYQESIDGAINLANVGRGEVAPLQFGGMSALYGAGNNQIGHAGQFVAAGTSALPYGNKILEAGFDPQKALYNRTEQQLVDQQRAANANAGISSSPYGAGVEGKTLSDFNIDWQNNLLGREATAAQGFGALTSGIGRDISSAESLYSGAGRAFAGASDLGSAGIGSLAGTFNLPSQVYSGQIGNNLAALGQSNSLTSGALAPAESALGNFGTYLNLTGNAGQLALANQNQGFNQGQASNEALGQNLAALSSGVNNPNLPNLWAPSAATSLSADPGLYGGTGAYTTDNMFLGATGGY